MYVMCSLLRSSVPTQEDDVFTGHSCSVGYITVLVLRRQCVVCVVEWFRWRMSCVLRPASFHTKDNADWIAKYMRSASHYMALLQLQLHRRRPGMSASPGQCIAATVYQYTLHWIWNWYLSEIGTISSLVIYRRICVIHIKPDVWLSLCGGPTLSKRCPAWVEVESISEFNRDCKQHLYCFKQAYTFFVVVKYRHIVFVK